MTDIIVVAVLAVIIGLAAFYVYKAKKSGKKCIGCPNANGDCKGYCSCDGVSKEDK